MTPQEAGKKWAEIKAGLDGRKAEIEATATGGLSFDRVVGDLKMYLGSQGGARTFDQGSAVSILKATIEIARAGLRLGVNDEAYLSCYKDQATKIPGYKGLIKLAMQSGQIEHISAAVVHANDEIDYSLGTDSFIKHKLPPKLGKRGPVIGAYVIAQMRDGKRPFIDLMNLEEIELVKAKARAGTSSPWSDPQSFPEMCKKTITRRGLKYLPVSNETREFAAVEDLEELAPDESALDPEAVYDQAAQPVDAGGTVTRLAQKARRARGAAAPAPQQAADAPAGAKQAQTTTIEAPPDAASDDDAAIESPTF